MFSSEEREQKFGTMVGPSTMQGLTCSAHQAGTIIEDFLRDALNFGLPKGQVKPLDAQSCKIRISDVVQALHGPVVGHQIWMEFRAGTAETVKTLVREGDPEMPLDWIWRRVDAYIGHIKKPV